MSGILKMPRMGETMDEGKLVAWLVEPGAPFKRGDPILEVETDKTVVEFPALGDGTLVESLVEIGEMVDVGTAIAKIDVGDGPDWISDGDDAPSVEEEAPAPEMVEAVAEAPVAASSAPSFAPSKDERIRATPLARRITRQANIDLDRIVGTGRRGRIERSDVEAGVSAVSGDLQTGYGIAWNEKGAATGAPVMFIHGFAADHSAWSGLQSQMARSGHRTLAVDLPAHGNATADAHDAADLAQPVIAMAEQKVDWQPLHIVAHSMGALVAVALAKVVPTASLTLIAPAGLGRTINTRFLDALAEPRDVASVARTLTSLTHGSNGLSDAAHAAIFATLSKGRLTEIAHALAGASGQNVDLRGDLEQIANDMPVSLLLGQRDQIVDWSEALDVSPLISVHHFPDAGHMPHWEALPQVQAILERKINA
ncbi:MAG: alpha/beta fold hydrolase [Paracoccaceae bacterium]